MTHFPRVIQNPHSTQQPRDLFSSDTAAFFDLDKTILATASTMALRSPLVSAGIMTRWDALSAAILQLPYLLSGADDERMQGMMKALGEFTRGWDPVLAENIVTHALGTSISPICYVEALTLIEEHRIAGHHVVIASASPLEIVRPVARMLGAEAALSTIVGTGEDGLIDGTIRHFNHGDGKALACAELAAERGWDLSSSFAYTDSVSDLPLLELVGHPVAVNPDRALAKIARERSWEITSFTHTARVRKHRKRKAAAAFLLPAAVAAGVLGASSLLTQGRSPKVRA